MPDILFGDGPAAPREAKIGTVSVDCTVEEVHGHIATVSRHPIELGSTIADHVQLEPVTVRLTALISNTPIEVPESQAAGVQMADHEFSWEQDLGGAGLVGIGVSAIGALTGLNKHSGTAKTFDTKFDRVRDCYAELRRLRDDREPFTVTTSLATYENMVVAALEVLRNAENGNVLGFTCALEQVRIVQSGSVTALPDPLELRAVPDADKGPRPVKPPDTATETKKSALLQGFQAAGLMQ